MKRKNITNSLKKNWLKGCLLLTFALFSTSVSATITVEASNKSIKEILKVIETKSEYRFFYNESLQELNKRSSIKVKNVSIDKILSILLDCTEIEYKLNKKNLVVLVAKIKASKKINGLVFNEIDVPIIGASIPIKVSKEGIIKDTNGNFSIDIHNNSALLISYIGCKISEYTIEQKKYTY